jgi:hypothetical protein
MAAEETHYHLDYHSSAASSFTTFALNRSPSTPPPHSQRELRSGDDMQPPPSPHTLSVALAPACRNRVKVVPVAEWRPDGRYLQEEGETEERR